MVPPYEPLIHVKIELKRLTSAAVGRTNTLSLGEYGYITQMQSGASYIWR
jgi:hypothetical protein